MSSTAMILLIITLLSLYLAVGIMDGVRRRYLQFKQQQKQQLQLYRLRRQGDLLKLWLRHPEGQLLAKAKPGQHLQLFSQDQLGHPISRAYSIVSDYKQRRYYSLAIKIEATGRLTPLLAQQLKQGQLLQCSYPKGHFQLEFSPRSFFNSFVKAPKLLVKSRPVVLIAGGIGITPLLPMVNAALRQQRPVTLVYQARQLQDLLHHRKLLRLAKNTNLHYLPVLSQPDTEWPGQRGRVHAAQLAQLGGTKADYLLCASATMVRELEQSLATLGCRRVQHELFSAAHSTQSFAITLGTSEANSLGHSSVLDALLASGVKVPFDCRGGSCGACALRLVSGDCKNVLQNEYTVGEHEILSCCVQANSPLHLEWPTTAADEQPLPLQQSSSLTTHDDTTFA
ncbi:MAG: 2Fe-2S iron-sulfur cluster binding domain-containing protein [Gammaproteobacteria bacterium]|nr:2Fe-2S iron-sulfur cluster binding domain-containing protein [Gammaproteobacteria bacterium]